jgi:hypothetical protein
MTNQVTMKGAESAPVLRVRKHHSEVLIWPTWLLQGTINHRLFGFRVCAILEIRLLSRDLRQCGLPAGLVQFFKSVETVSAETNDLASLGRSAAAFRRTLLSKRFAMPNR